MEEPWKCGDYGMGFIYPSQLEIHQWVHTKEKPFIYSVWGNSSHLLTHQQIHIEVMLYACTECGKGFPKSSKLKAHHQGHTSMEQPVRCTHSQSLLRHEQVHTGRRAYSCARGGKGFNQSSDLLRHQQVHTGDKPFTYSM
ncbi:zinc finger protein 239-like [Mobula hypostoma]|uniref:zinc finger protein 239-like n=1 Tax=Mobula hypostoma TaxID=723540 RepID=UPI002FC29235